MNSIFKPYKITPADLQKSVGVISLVFCVSNFRANGQSRTPVPTIQLANFLIRRPLSTHSFLLKHIFSLYFFLYVKECLDHGDDQNYISDNSDLISKSVINSA